MIPRATVAAALGLPATTDALPEGDLPLDRFAARYIAYLASGDTESDAADGWTGAVMDYLIAEDPDLALAAIRAGLPQDEADRLSDPLAELAQRPNMTAVISRAASDDPALARLVDRANAGDD
ncbi:hypothetical protein [uncultured Jannaschia sp.]|uniref:hypothetical protein n=1 Tax=uncultured Jannaschia sp. TaxID=293347 RepID=UPI00263A0D07|nr:hypothetical protein [uncultured Jannaschia sp.]